MKPQAKFELLHRYHCRVCGKDYGLSNLEYKGVPIWLTCECDKSEKVLFVEDSNIKYYEGRGNETQGRS